MHVSVLLALLGAASTLGAKDFTPENNLLAERDGLAKPQGWAIIDLDDLAAEGLQKRKAMTYCANQDSTGAKGGKCEPTSEVLSGTLARLLKTRADNNNCARTSGSVDDVAYTFETFPKGNCHTTAEQGTIQGGLNRYFDYLGNHICGVHCVRLDHSGTYHAYITLGPKGANLNSVSCARSDTYVDCGHGGQNDS